MKNFSSVAKKYLKVQKKRTILTCIGIILSVALITGTGTILTSIWDKFYRDAITDTGDFYAVFKNVPSQSANIINNHSGVEKTGQEVNTGYAIIAENKKDTVLTRKYLQVKQYDNKLYDVMPVKLLEGRLPANAQEIVLEKRAQKYMTQNPNIGDPIQLEIGDRLNPETKQPMGSGDGFMEGELFKARETQKYTVVGFIERRYSFSPSLFYAYTGLDNEKNENRNIYVKLDTNTGIRDKINQIARDANIAADNIKFNDTVLRYIAQSGSDNTNTTLIVIALFIVLIITIATVAVIYNSFHISVLERVSQFGLFRCIGATPAQIKGVVIKEAMIMAAVSIPIGVICGTLAIALVFELFKALSSDLPFADLHILLTPWIILPSILLSLITIYLSAAGPAKKASKVSPMEALRNTGDYKKEKIKNKKSKTGKKLMGVYGFVAWRNLGRNKKRVRVTVLSMVISIVLFIAISSFIKFTMVSGAVDKNEYVSFMVYSDENTDAILSDNEKEMLSQLGGVNNIFTVREMNVKAAVPENKLNPERIDIIKNGIEVKDKTAVMPQNTIRTIGDSTIQVLQQYVKEGKIDIDQMNKDIGVLVVNTVSIFQHKENKSYVFDIASLHPGDTIDIGIPEKDGFTEKVKVSAVLTQNVLGQNYNGFLGLTLITTDGVYGRISDNFNKQIESEAQNTAILTDAIYNPAQTMIQLQEKADPAPVKKAVESIVSQHAGWELIDYDEAAKSMQATVLVISILFYGFMTIIALIGALNIINTISTNILLRTRELSVLKAIGMSKRGLNLLVYLESVYYSIWAAIIGGALGTVFSWLFFKMGSMAKDIQWTIPWNDIFIALAGSCVICLIAGYLPLKRINSGVIIENIRQEQ